MDYSGIPNINIPIFETKAFPDPVLKCKFEKMNSDSKLELSSYLAGEEDKWNCKPVVFKNLKF